MAKSRRPTYRVAKALAAMAADLTANPTGVLFADAWARIEAVSGATSARTFARYVRALADVFDGRTFPRLVVDAEREMLRLEAPDSPDGS